VLYVPAGQYEHDDAPSILNVPAAQRKHASLEVLPGLGL
jgi:hypothetical protein